MPGQAPLIDIRTHGALVAEVEELAQKYTAGEVEPTVEALTGAVLDQDVVEGDETVAAAGSLVDAQLAERIVQIDNLGPVRVRGWQPPGPEDPPDAGSALVRIFARMAELTIARLNRVPDRDYLAFLDLTGTRPRPPQPARVPLTFHLAAGSPVDALVPARTQVAAAPLEGDPGPVLFETERDLVVTRSELAVVFTREPRKDLYRDSTAAATGQVDAVFPVFRGERHVDHRFYVGHTGLLSLPEEKSVILRIDTEPKFSRWLEEVDWEIWDGAGWRPVPAVLAFGESIAVTLPHVPAVPVSEVNGISSSWLRGRLRTRLERDEVRTGADGRTSLYRAGLTVDEAIAIAPIPLSPLATPQRRGSNPRLTEALSLAGVSTATDKENPTFWGFLPIDVSGRFHPFGETELWLMLFLGLPETYDQPGTQIEVEILLDESRPPKPTPDLQILWHFWGLGQLEPVEFTPSGPVPEGQRSEPFLVSGTVRFEIPRNWPKDPFLEGTPRRFLSVYVATGSFDAGGTFQGPVVESLRIHSLRPLPVVEDLRVGVEIDAAPEEEHALPDRGFSNQVPLDVSKDFLPFGEKPKVGDALYLASDEILSKPDAFVELNIGLTSTAEGSLPPPAGPSNALILAWEFWDGRQWQLLGRSGPGAGEQSEPIPPHQFTDGTKAFTKEAKVSFRVPASLVPVEVNGELRHWIRVRIAAGNYGVEARYDQVATEQGRPVYQLTPATFRPPSIRSARLDYAYETVLLMPEALLTENDSHFERVLPAGESLTFQPFRVEPDLHPTLYLGFDRPGAAIGFANRAAALYFGVAGALYDPGTEQAGTLEDAVVVWEYWNGGHWSRLGTRDETQGFTRRGLVTFIGPPDFRSSVDFGRQAFWLRARLERGSYAAEPELRRILTNTMWAVHARTIENEVLGSSRGEPGQTLRTVHSPVLEGQLLEVIEPEVPSEDERDEIEREEGEDAVRTVLDATGRPAEVRVRWHEVPDFYGSGPRSRHYTLDRATGEVRFGDGRRGLVPPPGRNNIRMAFYRTGGGLAGNRPAGNIAQLRGTVPYVDSVLQLEPASGGAAEESLALLEVRGPRALRHRDRAVALADFEDLALQSTTEVARARCIPAHDGVDAGTVGLIIVPRSTAAKPVPTLELLGRVGEYVRARLSPVVDLWVVGPDWLEVTVAAEVVPRVLEAATDVQTAVIERLSAFLHPLTGGFDGAGWEFGRKPYRSDLYALIEGTPGVDHVRRLAVSEIARDGGARAERFLVFSGAHEITVTGNLDESAADDGSPA